LKKLEPRGSFFNKKVNKMYNSYMESDKMNNKNYIIDFGKILK